MAYSRPQPDRSLYPPASARTYDAALTRRMGIFAGLHRFPFYDSFMIAYVSGKLVEKNLTDVVVDVQGLGYRVLIPASTYEALPQPGHPAKLLTVHHVREDAVTLFGFASEAERLIFEAMLGVSGVGPKLALATLSAMNPTELRDRILEGDAAMLTNIPGVGRKTAERLVVELKDKLAKLNLPGGGVLSGGSEVKAAARADALAALEALGFTRAQAEKRLRKVLRDHPGVQSPDELVRLALRQE